MMPTRQRTRNADHANRIRQERAINEAQLGIDPTKSPNQRAHWNAPPFYRRMPEGDTVFRTATNLRESLAGKILTGCDIRVPRYATVDLTGETVDEVISRSKHLFIRVGPASIHSHLKMEGSWRIAHPGSSANRPIRFELFCRPVLFVGGHRLGSTGDSGSVSRSRGCRSPLGPDLLGDDWNPELATANLTADRRAGPRRGTTRSAGHGRHRECVLRRTVLPVRPAPHQYGSGASGDPARVVARARTCCG